MIKYLITAIVLYILYIMFFRKKKEIKDTNNENKKERQNIESLVECEGCATFIAKDETIISNGKYYCSSECIDR